MRTPQPDGLQNVARLIARLVLIAAALAACAPQAAAETRQTPGDALQAWLAHLERKLPATAAEYSDQTAADTIEAARAIEQWADRLAERELAGSPRQVVDAVESLLAAKGRVDRLLDGAFETRRQFARLEEGPQRKNQIRAYLRATSELIDLSGRLRYLQVDALAAAVERVAARRQARQELTELFLVQRSSVGALVMAPYLLAPNPPRAADPPDGSEIRRLLELIEVSGQAMLLPNLAALLEGDQAPPDLKVFIAQTIRRLGLPQDPRPGSADGLPQGAITAGRLAELLAAVDPSKLSPAAAALHGELLQWLEVRKAEGLAENSYRLGTFDVEPGDWLLMRNPSPYNQFTDLSPGLFTHVGVVALERGGDGIARMVLVDLPERGTHMPATNVEAYVQRTLHYVFVRHPDRAVARDMAEAARQMIGNETQFDLSFRTDRVLPLAGRPLAGEKIHTYCAGLLLLCSLQTPLAREEFFPIAEAPAGGRTVENLATLGLSIGDDFISPTGALFAPGLVLVGRQEPMYDPRREVEEAVFDHFADLLAARKLQPSPDLFQSLRLKLAEASRTNALLARALAQAAQVDAGSDLVSAAKAAAVVETLDEIAFGSSGEFLDARDVLRSGPLASLAAEGLPAEELALARRYRQRHAGLARRLEQGRLSPRQLRQELVEYYIQAGKTQLERRFFASAE
ncbi:MAG: hypothetical protein WD278_14620 [Pirellulales bacterium]